MMLVLALPCACFAQDEASGALEIGLLTIIGFVLAGLGSLVSSAAGIWFLVIAFSAHVGWGLACFFLPLATLAFLITHWAEARAAFATQILGVVLTVGGVGMALYSTPALRQQIRELRNMEAAMQSPEAESPHILQVAQEPDVNADAAPRQASATPSELKPSATAVVPVTPDAIQIGDSVALVKNRLGRPSAEIQNGDQLILMYSGMEVIARRGQVVEISEARKSESAKQKTGLKKKKSLFPRSKAEPKQKAASTAQVTSVKTIREGGKEIELTSVLVPGKVTIVDFYADWCGPCKVMSPHLEKMAKADSDVVLRKIDIVNWASAVTKQYQIRSIPNVRVFDRSGKQLGSATSSLDIIAKLVREAK